MLQKSQGQPTIWMQKKTFQLPTSTGEFPWNSQATSPVAESPQVRDGFFFEKKKRGSFQKQKVSKMWGIFFYVYFTHII